MNIVRIALLSVTLFLAPYAIASEGASTVVTNSEIPAAKVGIVQVIKTFVNARKDNVVDGVDALAGIVTIPFKKLAAFECLKGGKFENSIPTIGRVIVSAAIVTGLYKLYTMYNASSEDNDDIIFEEEEYEDNN